jgi:beta-glucosidase
MMEYKAGVIWAGYLAPWDKIAYAIYTGQKYLMENTTLGIPAIFQSEGTVILLCSSYIFPLSELM